MSAELRLSLSDDTAAKLDAIRQPASRTAYAAYLLEAEVDRLYAERQRRPSIPQERIFEMARELSAYSAAYDPDSGHVNPWQDVISKWPEVDREATARTPEHLDIYVLTDGSVLECGEAGNWTIRQP